ncbi:MAG TPA: hypothetical protein VLV31_02475 [Candidatus Acidoferrales bacterium]|nr:hypothetical protein [Candidatus Acidoferrales bacterium]
MKSRGTIAINSSALTSAVSLGSITHAQQSDQISSLKTQLKLQGLTSQRKSGINYVCASCGELLYSITHTGTSAPSVTLQPSEVAAMIEKCTCGHRLRSEPDAEKILIIGSSDNRDFCEKTSTQ